MRKSRQRSALLSLVAVVLCIGVWPRTALAARVVSFEISVDGKVVLRAYRHDQGGASSDDVWRYLTSLTFGQSGYQRDRGAKDEGIAPDVNNPLRAKLNGKVRVFSRYGGDIETDSLELMRDKTNDRWKIAPKEYERITEIRKAKAKAKDEKEKK